MKPLLGRRTPKDWKHVELYALTVETTPDVPTPVVLGIPWYEGMSEPTYDARARAWWIKPTGRILGGHAICAEPGGAGDITSWWSYYEQDRNSCVGFSISRMASMLNRVRYDADWLYDEALKIDEWPGERDEGTSLRAGFNVLVNMGHRRTRGGRVTPPMLGDGITTYRWARDIGSIHAALRNPRAARLGAIPLLNSWGRGYPHRVWLSDEDAYTVIFERDGEAGIVTDR